MALAQYVQQFLMLSLCIACHSQQFELRVTVDPQTCLESDHCLTLTEFAQNSSFPRSSVKLVLDPGEHELTEDLNIEGADVLSILAANASGQTVINCDLTAAFEFVNVRTISIENVAFVSCGKNSSGISLSGIDSLSFSKVSLSQSIAGALYIKSSPAVMLEDFVVLGNFNSTHTIIQFENSEVRFTGTTVISNNSIGALMLNCNQSMTYPEVIFDIEDSKIDIENLIVENNTSPGGVVRVNGNVFHGNGIWTFYRNRVCQDGSMSLRSVAVHFNGSMTFTNNSVSTKLQSVAGILIKDSFLKITGSAEFFYNQGYTVAIESFNSNTTVSGILNISRNVQAKRGALFVGSSILDIFGTLDMSNNSISGWTIQVSNFSTVRVSVKTICVGNSLYTPLGIFFSNISLEGHIMFLNNVGVLYALASDVHISGTSRFIKNNIDDAFIDGTLALERSQLFMDGDYLFEGNQLQVINKNGGAIFATLYCEVTLSGRGNFTRNSAKYGGALYFDQMSSLYILPGTNLLFHQNKAVKGAAIFVQASFEFVNCSTEDYCLFELTSESDVNNISLILTDNTGDPGGSVLHASIDMVDFDIENQTFRALDNLNKTITLPDRSNSEPRYYTDSYLFCFCTKGSKQECEVSRRKFVTVTKGKMFSVTVRALRFYGDHNNEPVRSNLESLLGSDSDDESQPESSILPTLDGCFQVVHNEKCAELVFSVTSTLKNETIVLNIGESFLDFNKTLHLNVTFEDSCPLGFVLNDRNDKCICDPRIANHFVQCNLEEETFSRTLESIHFWIGSFDNSSSFLIFDGCPRGYCTANYTISLDSICTNNRTGRLCGECIDGCSLLIGGVKCDDCSEKNSYLALLIVFAALGVILVALIFLTQATVAMGTINGLILYMNIVDVNQSNFLPPDFFLGYTIFISWLNLDFGIDGVCFYDGMNQLQYAVWQFVFPIYLWLMVGIIIVICHYSVRASTFFGGNHPVAVLATIILLTYNSLVQNIINIFSSAHLEKPDNSSIVVWLYNGKVDFATGFHIALIVLALVFLVFFFFPFTLVLTSSQLLQKFDCTSKILQRLRLVPFINAYQAPFKPAHRYWVGLCLMMRALLLIIFSLAESQDTIFLSITTFCVICLSMYGITGGVYDKHWLNILEISFILNLGVFSAVRLYLLRSNAVLAYISVTVVAATFIGIVVFHVCLRLKKLPKVKNVIVILKNKFKWKKKKKEISSIEAQTIKEPHHNVPLREPLLESRS